MKNIIAVIDYGMGNLNSVSKAFEKVGADVIITSDSAAVRRARAVVLPGVGSFRDAMLNLRKIGMESAITDIIAGGTPFLGICLGLQLLFEKSQEGRYPGLGILKGEVKKFPPGSLKVPHMGWNSVKIKKQGHSIFAGVKDNSYFYFAHSYCAFPAENKAVSGSTRYGIEFASAVCEGNINAFQFHPEKSGETGLNVLCNFYRMVR